MCSIKDQDEIEVEEQQMIPSVSHKGILEEGGKCIKCFKAANTLYKLSFREAECVDCFLAYVRHKFRATLGSSKVLPREAEVLLIFDGSPEALMMVDMMHYALTQNTYKRLHCIVKVLCLQEDLQDQNIKDMQKYLECYTSLKIVHYDINELIKDAGHLMNLQNIASLTSQQDYLYEKRKRVILTAAQKFDCDFALLPDTSVKLAARLLTLITLGRGGSAAFDVALTDARGQSLNGVQLVRPLKDLNATEVLLYLHAQKLNSAPTFSKPPFGSEVGTNESLQNLTNAFIDNLQKNFSSTVSTLYRMSSKIAANIEDQNIQTRKCELCLSNIDVHSSNTLLAIDFSRVTSELGSALHDTNFLLKDAHENLLNETNKKITKLCHGCCNIMKDVKVDSII